MGGDIASLGKARRELEELYSGIPDESVNLTFQDFAEVRQLPTANATATATANPNMERNTNLVKTSSSSALTKLPSLDFNKAFEVIHHHNTNNNSYYDVGTTTHAPQFDSSFMDHYGEEAALHTSHLGSSTGVEDMMSNYNVVSYGHGNHASHHHHHHHQTISNTASGYHHQQQPPGFMGLNTDHHHHIMDSFSIGGTGTRRRRPGIPHSNICSICSVYMYMFRNNRCLVCGRVYCRQCVSIGMGEMTEGRKCIQCLGKRFSQRYIDRAGKTGGCCMGFLESSSTSRAKQREIEWAEKGPRKTTGGTNTNTNTATATPSRNYSVSPTPPTNHGAHRATPPPPDFSSPYSPYTTRSPASTYHFPL